MLTKSSKDALSLSDLLDDLDRFEVPVSTAYLRKVLRRLRLGLPALSRYVRFGRDCYKRNVLHNSPAYQALILCWRSGQRSPIHDHRGSACGVRVLKGTATEVVFERSPSGLIYPASTRKLTAGSICASFDSDIHQMGNLENSQEDLVTLHIYSPPLVAMRTYFLGDSILGEDDSPTRGINRIRASRMNTADGPLDQASQSSPLRRVTSLRS
jgi:cysteine dioxygenase